MPDRPPEEQRPVLTRREALALAAVPVVAAAGVGADALLEEGEGGGRRRARSDRRRLAPTPSCEDGPTTEQTEGPFFTPDSPRRSDLSHERVTGTELVLAGRVLSTDCRPLSGALLDFWQADGRGRYDTSGYRLRGHQLTDGEGRYRLITVVPGVYPGRTRHIHVKAQRRGESVLTTQLYFPGAGRNEQDDLFDPALLMRIERSEEGARGRFDFVLE